MSYATGTASNYTDLMDRIIRYLCGYATKGSVTQTGTGNGTLSFTNNYPSDGTFPATITETWTLTCTVAATNGGTFSVVGSVSGAQANATVGTPYSNSFIAFTIADGTTDFIVGDQFTFTTTQGAMKAAGVEWIYQGRAAGQTTGGWVKGRGLSGTDSIYFGMQGVSDVPNDIYNIQIAGSQGFSTGSAWGSQVGQSPNSYTSSWNSPITYWIVANGQRVIVVAKVSTTYHAIHAGKILPYGTPDQYPYPVYIGGESVTSLRWSDTTPGYRNFTDPGSSNSPTVQSGCYLCFPDGSWQSFWNFIASGSAEVESDAGRSIWPYSGDLTDSGSVDSRLRELRDNIDGSYTLLPLIMHCDTPSRQVFGELDGCYWVSGHGNASENIVTISGQDYLVFQNIFRTNRWNYAALKLA